jgi:putative membrane protein
VTELARPARVGSLAFGVLTALVALEGPLDHAAEASAAWHMAQHVLLLSVVAPLLVLGAPLRRLRRTRWAQRVASRATPWFVTLGIAAQSAVLAAWHLPGPYQAAVRNPLVHALEHAAYLGAGALLWWALLHASRARIGIGVLALFVAALPGTALGVLMTSARTVWYPVYGTGSAALGDQQLAGVVMWAVGNTVSLIAAVALFAFWLASLERVTPARPAASARS